MLLGDFDRNAQILRFGLDDNSLGVRALVSFRQLHQEACALASLHARHLAVPFVDVRTLVLQAAEFQQLRRQRALADPVGIGLALRASPFSASTFSQAAALANFRASIAN